MHENNTIFGLSMVEEEEETNVQFDTRFLLSCKVTFVQLLIQFVRAVLYLPETQIRSKYGKSFRSNLFTKEKSRF